MVTTIVVPLDGSPASEAALAPALGLARAFAADVVLFQAAWGEPDPSRNYLTEVAARLDADRPVTVEVGHGFAGSALAALVEAHAGAVVCMTSRGHGGVSGILLGSVAEEILAKVACPVVLVGPDAASAGEREPASAGEREPAGAGAGGRIAACVDGSPPSLRLAPLLAEWAGALGGGVDVVTVLDRGGHVGDAPGNDVRAAVGGFVAGLAARGIAAEAVELTGVDPAAAIVRHAGTQPVALVAATSRGHHRALDGVLGSTALRLVRHAPVPVLVVPTR
jgi:nucleotide-binding universal stress UspA family protein